MINDSEGLGTPHEAFCRIVAVIHPENPGLGKKVTGPHWHYEFPPGPDALAIGNALGFLNANVSAGKISAQGIRKGTEHDGPKPINTAELRTGNLKVWDGTLECRSGGTGGRLYQHVFLSMADLNRALGVPLAESPQQVEKTSSDELAPPTSPKGRAQRAIAQIRKDPSLDVDKMSAPVLTLKVCELLKSQRVTAADMPSQSTVERADKRRP
jgi:hypothetical protein